MPKTDELLKLNLQFFAEDNDENDDVEDNEVDDENEDSKKESRNERIRKNTAQATKREILKDLGVESLEDLKELTKIAKEYQDEKLSEKEKLEKEREELENAKKTLKEEKRVAELLAAGVPEKFTKNFINSSDEEIEEFVKSIKPVPTALKKDDKKDDYKAALKEKVSGISKFF